MTVEEERQAYITNPNGDQNKRGEIGELDIFPQWTSWAD
jgi:hypothetical protein